MSIASLRTAIATAGGTPTAFERVKLYRQLVTAMGGTPQLYTVAGLLRQLITLKSGTPTKFDEVGLLRQFVAALGASPTAFEPDRLEAQMSLLTVTGPPLLLELNFKTGSYKASGTTYALTAMPGYSYTRSGAKAELNALTSGDMVDDFAANVPGIVPGVGYWSRAGLTNLFLRSQEIDNAAWAKAANGGATLPVVTANAATAPDGTLSADQIAYPAVSGAGAASSLSQTSASLSGTMTGSLFLRGAVGGEVISLWWTPNAVNFQTVTVTLTTAWQRVVAPGAGLNSSFFFVVGTDLRDAGQTAKSTQTVFAWQGQVVAGSVPDGGPIIPTTTAAVAVGADALQFSLANGTYNNTVYTYADNTTETIPTTVAAGVFTVANPKNKAISLIAVAV